MDSSWRLQSCWLAVTEKETTTTTARPVKTTIVESRSIIRKDFGNREAVGMRSWLPGQRTIIQLPVIEGQKVKKGQFIAAIDPRDIAVAICRYEIGIRNGFGTSGT